MAEDQVNEDQHPISIALGLLFAPSRDRFLLQLRDDFPHILFPGHWGLFGGHLEPGETPDVAIVRELTEELGYVPQPLAWFRTDRGPFAGQDGHVLPGSPPNQPRRAIVRHFFYGEIAVDLGQLQLGEGQDLAWATAAEIESGQLFSHRLQETRPIIPSPHRSTLLDFIAQMDSQMDKPIDKPIDQPINASIGT